MSDRCTKQQTDPHSNLEMSKRERFAMMALQGCVIGYNGNAPVPTKVLAILAVKFADALVEALNAD